MAPKQQSKNVARLNQDIKRELVDIIGNMKDPWVHAGLLTVTHVETAPDLSSAKVYVSVLGGQNAAAAVVETLNKAKGHVRSEIASRMHIRRSPELFFIEDDSAAYADHINRMLNELE